MNTIPMNATCKNIAHQAIYDWANKELGNGTIMDIGSELGFGLRHLSSRDRHVIGLDIQFDELVFSKTYDRPHENEQYVCADGMVIPFSDGFCGGLCMVNVLHLVHDPIQILKECWRILSPHGLLIVTIPTDYNLPDNWRIPSEKEYFKTVLKKVFSSVEFPQKNHTDKEDAIAQRQGESGLLTAICRKTIFQ